MNSKDKDVKIDAMEKRMKAMDDILKSLMKEKLNSV